MSLCYQPIKTPVALKSVEAIWLWCNLFFFFFYIQGDKFTKRRTVLPACSNISEEFLHFRCMVESLWSFMPLFHHFMKNRGSTVILMFSLGSSLLKQQVCGWVWFPLVASASLSGFPMGPAVTSAADPVYLGGPRLRWPVQPFWFKASLCERETEDSNSVQCLEMQTLWPPASSLLFGGAAAAQWALCVVLWMPFIPQPLNHCSETEEGGFWEGQDWWSCC